eukprot:scaffold5185_cov198-Alexandrium_tamarense.AAC.9
MEGAKHYTRRCSICMPTIARACIATSRGKRGYQSSVPRTTAMEESLPIRSHIIVELTSIYHRHQH